VAAGVPLGFAARAAIKKLTARHRRRATNFFIGADRLSVLTNE